MHAISKLGRAALLAGSAAALAFVSPAAAQVAPPRLTAPFIKLAKPAQDAVLANSPSVAEAPLTALEASATNEDERYVAAVLRLALEQQKYAAAVAANPKLAVSDLGLVKPLNFLMASPSTPPADRARYLVRRGEMAFAGKQYPVALDLFNRARAAGANDENLALEIVRARIESGDVAGGTAELERTVAAMQARGQKAPADYYRFAIARANKSHLTPQTVGWMRRYVAAYPSGPTWYEVLTSYGLQQDATVKLDAIQKLDLFRLLRASGGLGDQYYYQQYIQAARDAGLPVEAQAVLKEGVSRGLIPAAAAETKALTTQLASAAKLAPSAAALEAKAGTASNGLTAPQAADAYLGAGNYAKAAALYRTALAKGGVDADTLNTRLGIALARSGDKTGAQAAFAEVKSGSRGDIAALWQTWLDNPTTPAAAG